MKNNPFITTLVVLCLALSMVTIRAQQHRAVRLGHPSTRFAPPLTQPDELRALLTGEKMKADVASILLNAGWKGKVEDLRRAARTASISEISLPNGTRMPFMSSRKDGKPIVLMDVLWAGDEPIRAYAFDFSSNGRRCRCVTPKACSNFFVVDLGPSSPELAIACDTPGETLVGRRFDVCLTVTNKGTATASQAALELSVPPEATLIRAPGMAGVTNGILLWRLSDLEAGNAIQASATFIVRQPAFVSFSATVRGDASVAKTFCDTLVAGIPAILLETADLEDPIEVGKEATYEIKVTNQGSAPGTNLKVLCTLPDSEEFVSGSGPTQVQARDRAVTMDTLAILAPKELVTWRVVVKALKADDARFKVFIRSDQFQQPIQKDEATHLYE